MSEEYIDAYRTGMLWCWAIRTPPGKSNRNEWGPGFFGKGNAIDYSLYPVGKTILFSTRSKAETYLQDFVIQHRNGARDCRVVRVCVRESVHEMKYFPKSPRNRRDDCSSHRNGLHTKAKQT